jgi:hypothetical protein
MLAKWAGSSTSGVAREPAVLVARPTPLIPAATDPWETATPIPVSFIEGIDLKITENGILVFGGIR